MLLLTPVVFRKKTVVCTGFMVGWTGKNVANERFIMGIKQKYLLNI